MNISPENKYIVNNLVRIPYIIISGVAIACCVALAASSGKTSIRILAAVGFFLLCIVLMDSIVRRKFHFTENHLCFRQSFIWKKWKWEEIEQVRTARSSWFGQEVHMVEVVLADGSSLVLEETKSLIRFSQITDIVERIEEARVLSTIGTSKKDGVNDDGKPSKSRS